MVMIKDCSRKAWNEMVTIKSPVEIFFRLIYIFSNIVTSLPGANLIKLLGAYLGA